MQKTLLLVLLACACHVGYGQTYPISVRLALEKAGDSSLINESTVRYQSGQSNVRVTSSDALIWGYDPEQTGSLKDTNLLTLHTRNFATAGNDTVTLLVRGLAGHQYFLATSNLLLPGGFQAVLRDRFTGNQVVLAQGQRYAFSVTAAAASQGLQRFQLLVRSAATLAARFCNTPAVEAQGAARLIKACLSHEGEVAELHLQASADGRRFATIATEAVSAQAGVLPVVLRDEKPLQDTRFYRVAARQRDGQWLFSAVVAVAGHKVAIQLFPNPVINQLQVQGAAGCRLLLTDAQGRLMRSVQIANGGQLVNMQGLAKGQYRAIIHRPDGGLALTQWLVKQ